jgi:hypothetical protein
MKKSKKTIELKRCRSHAAAAAVVVWLLFFSSVFYALRLQKQNKKKIEIQ